jgi:hypothetical protein
LRREICELQYDLAQVFVPLLSQMDEHKLKLHDFFLFKLVNENLDKPKRMPDDIELSSRIKETSAYKKGFTSVLFRNIEESSDNYKITKLSKGLTIEHIMPQNPEFNSSYFEEYKNNEELFDKYLNKIGNLTLLTRHENLLATCR